MAKKSDDQYSKGETEKRFEAALRGARVTGHKPKVSTKAKKAKRRKTNAMPR